MKQLKSNKYFYFSFIKSTFLYRSPLLIIVFVLMFSGCFLLFHFCVPNEYESEIVLCKDETFSYWRYDEFFSYTYKSCEESAYFLSTSNIKYSNGKDITKDDISSNLFFVPYVDGSFVFTIKFKSYDSTIIEPVLNTLADVLIDKVCTTDSKGNKVPIKNYEGIKIYKEASTPKRDRGVEKELLFSSLLCSVLSFATVFLVECYNGKIHSCKELSSYNIDCTEIKTS